MTTLVLLQNLGQNQTVKDDSIDNVTPYVAQGGQMVFDGRVGAGDHTLGGTTSTSGPTVKLGLTIDPSFTMNNSWSNSLTNNFGMGLLLI